MRQWRVKEWENRKAVHEVDPIQVLKDTGGFGEGIEYVNHDEQLYSLHVQLGSGLVLAKTDRAVIANRTKFYVPVHDVNYKRLVPSKKRHRWARGEQVWYNVVTKDGVIIQNAAYAYPLPKTHAYVQNCVTFLRGRGITVTTTPARKSLPPKASIANTNDSRELKKTSQAIETRKNDNDGGGRENYFRFIEKPSMIAKEFLSIRDKESGNVLCCHTNCTRQNQGTAFLEPAIKCGETQEIVFHMKNKPGRMCYFFGVARSSKLFPPDSSQQIIRQSGLCLENLYGSLHEEVPSSNKALPSFHTGSKLKLTVQNDEKGKFVHLRIQVDSSGKIFKGKVKNERHETVRIFCSLYNRNAEVHIL